MVECPFDPTGVVPPALPLLGTTLELVEDLLLIMFVPVSVPEGCSPMLTPAAEISRCSGEEGTGEPDFLLVASPLPPPREEFRGETLPVYIYPRVG